MPIWYNFFSRAGNAHFSKNLQSKKMIARSDAGYFSLQIQHGKMYEGSLHKVVDL
jgi:hypothetical protein